MVAKTTAPNAVAEASAATTPAGSPIAAQVSPTPRGATRVSASRWRTFTRHRASPPTPQLTTAPRRYAVICGSWTLPNRNRAGTTTQPATVTEVRTAISRRGRGLRPNCQLRAYEQRAATSTVCTSRSSSSQPPTGPAPSAGPTATAAAAGPPSSNSTAASPW
ncbi:hypothetical protein [Streptomyces sp. CC210A]|uniref:hypothetical protein n=1 Tax=Streptomyces sp. CC210A TaxID=2898184 RepID=UPI001F456384|nr:hypothetical protein [Streptomyces sp. CC210A]